jgi:hypothetical protein
MPPRPPVREHFERERHRRRHGDPLRLRRVSLPLLVLLLQLLRLRLSKHRQMGSLICMAANKCLPGPSSSFPVAPPIDARIPSTTEDPLGR